MTLCKGNTPTTGLRSPVLRNLRNGSGRWARTSIAGVRFIMPQAKTWAASRSIPGQAHRRGTWIGHMTHRSCCGNILGPPPRTARSFPMRGVPLSRDRLQHLALYLEHSGAESTGSPQLLVGSLLYGATLVENQDLVHLLHRRHEAVGDQEHRMSPPEPLQRFQQLSLGDGVQVGRGLVQHEQRGIFKEG